MRKRFFARVISAFRNLFKRESLERELDEELESYLEMRMNQLIDEGVPAGRARREALLELGGIEQVKEKVREERAGSFFDMLAHDLRYAFRSLRKDPGFSIVTILILALGIGTTTAFFSSINTILLGQLPFPEPDRLVLGQKYFRDRVALMGSVSAHDFVDFRERVTTCTSLASFQRITEEVIVIVAEDPLAADLTHVSWNYFSTLGVLPLIGRDFRPDEELGVTNPVLISHDFWSRQLSADTSFVGKDLEIGSIMTTVIGVMPQGFKLISDVDLWMPFVLGEGSARRRDQHNFLIVGRLHPGTSIERAQQECEAISLALEQEYPDSNTNKTLKLEPLHDFLVADVQPKLLLLMATMLLFLLIACSNVAGLLLAKGQKRLPEMAVRSALGASRSRLVRQLLTESTLITLLAGVMGVCIAFIGLDLLVRFMQIDRLGIGIPEIDGTAFLFALGMSLLCGIIVGITPAMQNTGGNSHRLLRSGARTSMGRSGTLTRDVLTILQTAASIFLLVLAGLLMKSMAQLVTVDPGFETRNLLISRIQISPDDYPTRAGRWQFFESLLENVEALPGVVSAGVVDQLPIADPFSDWGVWPADRPQPESSSEVFSALTRMILPGYFETLGMPLMMGRDIASTDASDTLAMAVINETMAESFWPGENPIGRIILHGGSRGQRRVVGIVRDAYLRSLRTEPLMAIYIPYTFYATSRMRLAVRASRAPESLAEPIRGIVQNLDANALFTDTETFEAVLDGEFADLNVILSTLGLLAAISVILTSIGLYGLLAYQVSQRRNELGVRLALGASRRNLFTAIVGRGISLVGMGLVVGVAATWPATRFIQGYMFETEPWDSLSYIGAVLFLGVIALLACAVPARRATLVKPVEALRLE